MLGWYLIFTDEFLSYDPYKISIPIDFFILCQEMEIEIFLITAEKSSFLPSFNSLTLIWFQCPHFL